MTIPPEQSLDPQDWEAMRELGHQMVDDMLDWFQQIEQEHVWQALPEAVHAHFATAIPQQGQDAQAVYEEFKEYVVPYRMGNIHPRFWGWVMGNGNVMGMFADMLAAAVNPNMGGAEHAPVHVEYQVIDWCKQMLGYTANSSGLLTSGASVANLTGLAVARNAKANFDIRKDGLQGERPKMVLYASAEVHSCNQKAVEMLGLGSDALRYIPVNDDYQIDIDALETALAADKAAGHQPFCIIGTAGTVKMGAFDDLNALADICEREHLWFHVDGAFGALAAITADYQQLVAGMTRADSLAFDMHKWMYLPFEIACVLVKDPDMHYHTFTLTPDYLTHGVRGLAANERWLSDYGMQLSRGFRALKAWMSIKTHGIDKFGQLVQQNIEQAQYLAALVDQAPQLQRTTPVPLNIVCLRYVDESLRPEQLNPLNEELLLRIQESGVAIISNATVHGSYCLRACITNHRTRRSDLDLFIEKVLATGAQLVQEFSQQAIGD